MPYISNFRKDRVKKANVKDLFSKPKIQYNNNKKEDFDERIIDWVTFYRRNIHRFVEHYFGFELYFYQKILIYLMNVNCFIVIVACRASAKSYLIAIYACARCVLYPNSKIVIASSTKKQSSLIVSEKIKKELIPNSPNLAKEIKDIRTGMNETEVVFHNGSSIIVVPATENARGARATVNIYEEFRMIKKEIVDSVLSPFLIVRPTPYLKNPIYAHLQEEPIEIYISSAWFRNHWMWDIMRFATKSMYNAKDALIIGFDYSITLKHGIRTRKQLRKERKKMDATTYAMEYQNLMIGSGENAYYTFDLINKAQKIKKAFYPRKNLDVIENKKNKHDIPKQKGEIRVVSCDIAMVINKSGRNDNTAIVCMRALPFKDYYERQVVYIEAFNGGNTTEQAVRIKQIYYDFNSDYLVLDAANSGLNVADELGKILYDDSRDCEYPSWKSFNDENTANRIKIKDSQEVIYSIKADASFNHEVHLNMKDVLEKGKLKLLINSVESKDYLETKKEYINASPEEKVSFDLPYINNDLMINEMINLSYEINKNTNKLKLVEPRNGTKDRYISMGYCNLFVKMLEQDLYIDEDESSFLDYLFV